MADQFSPLFFNLWKQHKASLPTVWGNCKVFWSLLTNMEIKVRAIFSTILSSVTTVLGIIFGRNINQLGEKLILSLIFCQHCLVSWRPKFLLLLVILGNNCDWSPVVFGINTGRSDVSLTSHSLKTSFAVIQLTIMLL